MILIRVATVAIGLLALAGCKQSDTYPNGVDQARIVEAANSSEEWLTHYGDWRNRQYSALEAIDRKNVGGLKLAWSMDMDTNRGVEATPIVADGIMYVTGSWSQVYAIDAQSGRRLWHYDPEVPGEYAGRGCCDVVNRGVALWGDKVLLGTFDGRLIAIHKKTGKPVWTQDTLIDRKRFSYTITGAPLVANGLVIIGNGGAELGARGYVTAYDIATGKQVWRFFTVPGDPSKPFESKAMAKAATTWTGKYWEGGGGGTVWDSMAYDPELDMVYLGVGNGTPWNRSVRSPNGGDNLFLSSIVALKRKSGEYVWHYQQVPGEEWDYTATQHLMLLDLQINGKIRKTIVQAPKNGFFYVLDRSNGELLSAKNFVPVTWTNGIDLKTGRPRMRDVRYETKPVDILPGPTGAHNWQPMAFLPKTGLVYIPSLELGPTKFETDRNYRFKSHSWNVAVDFKNFVYPESPEELSAIAKGLKGDLIAWDPVRQKERWRFKHRAPWNGGVLATASGLIFQGTSDGYLLAIDAVSGRELWRFFCQTGVMAAPISFRLAGTQYISVAVGWGGHYGLEWGPLALEATGGLPNKSRVLTFALDGKATLPAPEKWQGQLEPMVAIPPNQSNAMETEGRTLYARYCSACHGGAAISGGVLPDLRNISPEVYDGWDEIVLEGSRSANGMGGFKSHIDRRQSRAIRAYVLSRAHRTWMDRPKN